MKPFRSILDASFKYIPAASTDVKATFERIRREAEKSKETDKLHQKIFKLKRIA